MERIGMPLLLHGEVTDPDVDVFDREAVFIERVLAPLARRFPGLKIVLEHVTTREAVEFVSEAPARPSPPPSPRTISSSTATPSSPAACARTPIACRWPSARRTAWRCAAPPLRAAPRFFLGTDTAPHPVHDKERDCGCAGIFSAPAALEIYAQVFEEEDALDRLETFASLNGPRFYGLPVNEGRVRLVREAWRVPRAVATGAGPVRPFLAGEELRWRLDGAA